MKPIRFLALILVLSMSACNFSPTPTKSDSGVSKASVKVQTDAEGHTIEQKNIMERLKRDNDVASIKHLYVISSFTGDVLQYSTVKGKVTSGNKRISPKTVDGATGLAQGNSLNPNYVSIGNKSFVTDEVLDDGGTYGESGNYLFWFDTQGNYHQYYPSGGTYLEICDKPLRVKKTNLSIELNN